MHADSHTTRADTDDALPQYCQRFKRLVDQRSKEKLKDQGRKETFKDVAEGIKKMTGVDITAPYLNMLYKGKTSNPSHEKHVAICTYYGVATSFFDPRSGGISAGDGNELDDIVHSKTLNAVGMSIEDMSLEDLLDLQKLISQRRQEKGLPEVDTTVDDHRDSATRR